MSHLICRRVREAGVYCELRSCLLKLEDPQGLGVKGFTEYVGFIGRMGFVGFIGLLEVKGFIGL